MPRLSVLLPALNAQSTVSHAVRSTLTALPRDSELTVLNDGSTDATSKILHSITDKRLKIIDGQGSGGVAQALNLLLDSTDSEFVARMDADDICLPWRFTTAMGPLKHHADVVFSPVIDLKGRLPIPDPPMPITPEAFGLHLLLRNPVSHPTMIARRSTLEAAHGYRAVPSEDYDLWLRLVAAGVRLQRVAVWGVVYRIHSSQITASSSWRSRSWNSPQQAESFAAASEHLVGEPLKRLVQISQMEPVARAHALAAFEQAIQPAVASISGVQGALLSHKYKQRLTWVKKQLAHPSSQSVHTSLLRSDNND